MNFDKFKKLKPRSIAAPSESESYSKELASLKSRPKGTKTVSIISSVAAAILIVAVVAVWAIIGRGIRQNDPVIDEGPAGKPSQSEKELVRDESLTATQREQFFDIFADYKINAMPAFKEGVAPDITDMGWYIFHLNQSDINSGQFPADVFESEVTRLFGFDYDLQESELTLGEGELTEFPFAELIGYDTEQADEGTVVTATAAVYYMWNLTEQNCDILYPTDFAIAKGTVTSGDGNKDDISGIYVIKYLSDDGINPTKFLSLEKYISPSDEYNEFFE